jgi:hypothetical protein
VANLIYAILMAQTVFIAPVLYVSSKYLFSAHADQSSIAASFRKQNRSVLDPLCLLKDWPM